MGKHIFGIIILLVTIAVCVVAWLEFSESELPTVPAGTGNTANTGNTAQEKTSLEGTKLPEPSMDHLPLKVSEHYQRKKAANLAGGGFKPYRPKPRPDENQINAGSGELAGKASDFLGRDPSLSLRLAEASLNLGWNMRAEKTVWEAMKHPLYDFVAKHEGEVMCAVFSPDGRQVATASRDLRVRIWEWNTRVPLVKAGKWEWKGVLKHMFDHADEVFGVSFSPDGKRIATASKDGIAKVLDVKTGREQMVFDGHSFAVTHVVFSPDGNRVATSSLDKTARIWDADKGDPDNLGKPVQLAKLDHPDEVCDIDFSRDGKHVATACKDGIARIWNTDTQQIVTQFDHSGQAEKRILWSVMFSTDYARLISASENNTAKIWNCYNEMRPPVQVAHPAKNTLYSAAFSTDGRRIITASGDKTAIVWNAGTGRRYHVLKGHEREVLNVSFSPNGKKALTASKDGTARIWDLGIGAECQILKHGGAVLAVKFVSRNRVKSVSRDKTAGTWKIGQTSPENKTPLSLSFIQSSAISPNGRHAVLLPGNGTAVIVTLAKGKSSILHTLKAHTDDIVHAAFSGDGSMIATASKDGTARIWNVLSGKQLHLLEEAPDRNPEYTVYQVAFSPYGNIVATGTSDGYARLWNLEDKTYRRTLGGHRGNVRTVAFSPDGERIVTSSDNGGVRIWSVKSGNIEGELGEDAGHLETAVFSPNGKYVVTASKDGTVSAWDAATGEKIHDFWGHTAAVFDITFSPDGNYMATASLDKTLRIRPFDSREIMRLINRQRIRGIVRKLTEEEREKYGVKAYWKEKK